jgi:hypothetical protein
MPRVKFYDLADLRDPEETPYEGYRVASRPEPPYATLVVGPGLREAYDAQGRRVDEHTGQPLEAHGRPTRGRPRKEP